MRSYSSTTRGLRPTIREVRNLIGAHSRSAEAEMHDVIARAQRIERLVDDRYGVELVGLRMLDVGAGQRALQMKYFSRKNDVVGIDRDVVVQGFEPAAYIRMVRTNGVKRAVKTVGRKVLGIDSKQSRELARQLNVKAFPTLDVRQMNAENLAFPDSSFDFVYCLAVLPHLGHPQEAVREFARVLAPAGIAYLDFVLYTSRTGSHDIRLLGGRQAELPLWAHLRPEYEELVQPSAYLNKLRIHDWKELFAREMPTSQTISEPAEEWVAAEATRLHEQGELGDYSLEELTTTKLTVLWQKPAA
jgi:SAM-dependent methyltransferase